VFKAIQIRSPVGVVVKDAVAVITAGEDMGEGPGEFDARPACHRESLRK
jgi:hypothetical protein